MDGAILVVAATDGRCRRRGSTFCWRGRWACRRSWCSMNKCDAVEDPELLELVELEVRELLKLYQFPGDTIPVVRGSALGALNGEAKWRSRSRS